MDNTCIDSLTRALNADPTAILWGGGRREGGVGRRLERGGRVGIRIETREFARW